MVQAEHAATAVERPEPQVIIMSQPASQGQGPSVPYQKKAELSSTIQTSFENQGRVVRMIGKTGAASIRLEGHIQMEMMTGSAS